MLNRVSSHFVILACLLWPVWAWCGGESAVFLELSREDIQDIAIRNGTVWIKLNPEAKSALRQVTEKNFGRMLHVSYAGLTAVEMPIYARVDSGVIQISDASPELLSALRALQRVSDPAYSGTD